MPAGGATPVLATGTKAGLTNWQAGGTPAGRQAVACPPPDSVPVKQGGGATPGATTKNDCEAVAGTNWAVPA